MHGLGWSEALGRRAKDGLIPTLIFLRRQRIERGRVFCEFASICHAKVKVTRGTFLGFGGGGGSQLEVFSGVYSI